MELHVTKPKVQKGLSYVLKTSMLKDAMELNNIDIPTFITYGVSFKIPDFENVFECAFRKKDKSFDHDQLQINIRTVESKNRKNAEELIMQKVIPKFIEWVKRIEALPANSSHFRIVMGFHAYYKEGEVEISCFDEKI